MAFWAAAQLSGAREHFALRFLAQAGFLAWMPLVRERKIIRGRKQVVTPALFPTYAFVLIELQWHVIRRTPYVVRLVMDGERPARVPDQVIEDLRKREKNGAIELPEPAPRLRPGGRVRVASGPFRGHSGLVAGMSSRERVIVLLSLLGAQTRVTLAAHDVEAVG